MQFKCTFKYLFVRPEIDKNLKLNLFVIKHDKWTRKQVVEDVKAASNVI